MQDKRRFKNDYFLFCIALGGIIFPVLFYSGYKVHNTETLVIGIVFLVVTLAVTYVCRAYDHLFLALLLSLNIAIFYLPPNNLSIWIFLFLALYALGKFKKDVLIVAVLCVSASGLLAAPFVHTRFVHESLEGGQKAVSDKPSVIHIVLDEYIGTDELPRDIFSDAEVEALGRFYEERGFARFQKSFSSFSETQKSLAQVFNPDARDIDGYLSASPSNRGFSLKRSEILSDLSAGRHFQAMSDYLYFDGMIGNGLENYTLTNFNTSVPFGLQERFNLPLLQRVHHAIAISYGWIFNTQEVGVIKAFIRAFAKLTPGSFNALDSSGIVSTLGSMVMLDEIIEETIPKLGRGHYLYAHLLLPHYPYTFDRNCDVLAAGDWSSRRPMFSKQTVETRRENYRLYYEQLLCVHRKIDALISAIDANPKLHDTTIIIHGDHGPRIGFWPQDITEEVRASGYTQSRYLKDFLSTSFAVRLPDGKAQTFSNPIGIHQIYQKLYQADFQHLDVDDVTPPEIAVEIFPELSASLQ